MDRILTLLLVFLISLAPAAPAEATSGHAHAMAHTSVSHQPAHEHGTQPTAEAPAAECSLAGGHCVLALVTPLRDFIEVGFNVATCSAAHDSPLAQGVVLTSEPPPPRA